MGLFRGQLDLTLILPVAIGLIYAGTGQWTAERWNTALAVMGLGGTAKAAERLGYERGYGTLNPNLRSPELVVEPPVPEVPEVPEALEPELESEPEEPPVLSPGAPMWQEPYVVDHNGRRRDEHGRFVRERGR